jgi:hypothetical protein
MLLLKISSGGKALFKAIYHIVVIYNNIQRKGGVVMFWGFPGFGFGLGFPFFGLGFRPWGWGFRRWWW